MAAHPPRRTGARSLGFAPEEISQLVNRRVIEIHAGEAAFLWMQRDRAWRAPHYKLEHLARLDARLEGHLEGLRLAPGPAWQAVQRLLADCDAGAVFVAATLAFSQAAPEAMRFVLRLALGTPAYTDGLVAALAWADPGTLQEPVQRLLASPLPAHRRIGLAVCAALRRHPGPALAEAVASADEALRARALRAAGELSRHELAPLLQRAATDDPHPPCRLQAGLSLALLGEPHGAAWALEAARQGAGLSRDALELGIRCGTPAWARDVVRQLAADRATLALAVHAAGALGDPSCVPWLLELMDDDRWARVAGGALSMITGADLAYLDLHRDAPEAPPEDEAPGSDDLPWPQRERLAAWWSQQRGRYLQGQRYLAGLPVSAAACSQVLRTGTQPQRAAAAIELARLGPSMPFPVAAPSRRQRAMLAP